MDGFSLLPDDTLSKILSFLETKDVMQTMLLSKRFKSLWKLVPRLEFDDMRVTEHEYAKFWRFVDRAFMSHEGQALQNLHLKLRRQCTDGDVAIWVGTAVKRGLMELEFMNYNFSWTASMPKSLYTCGTLVVLKLLNVKLDVPDLVCLRSLKTLSLKYMNRSEGSSSLLRLLPNCPVLEDLFIHLTPYPNPAMPFKIVVPSLKRLSLFDSCQDSGITGLVLDAPCLKFLHVVDRWSHSRNSQSINMNEVVEDNMGVILNRPEKLLRSLASVEHILLCLSAPEVVYPVGSCFSRLKFLEVCPCKSEWLDLFMRLLKDSPSVKSIKINRCHCVLYPPRPYIRPHWNRPSSVPRCLSSNLEFFKWINYEGTQEEKELSTYILKTAVCLKKASFTAKSNDDKKKLELLRELSLSRRASSTCELVFN
ncbi:unnamed protein product [Microthlaspi erraticum]|uniref:F-box domain-containing protein n=1 Tax=Microthlaspi erraticum TaxID=1685480 RepID=A0A6D2LD47_9BRAS|nr:unnamed protein product [Microthlaspi erraticum]